ncbi:MAG: flagellar hook-associated protein FlgK [Candidatus Kapabacteria bacterium]|nr:flagellar hook-associated protein FlgK [Candidatus Kapabacteria bacterium]MDW8225850.1 flagellar hook-associated protein FlgK [Bacteroidota bacterium]
MGFRVLHIARSGLLAQQRGIEVTSGNIANVNTPGYTRRRVRFSPVVPEARHAVGSGVQVRHIEEFRSRYLDSQIRSFLSRQARSHADEFWLQRLSAILGEPNSETGIHALLRRFFDVVQELVLHPEDLSLRELLLQRAEEIATAFRRLGADFQALRTEISQRLAQRVEQLNPLFRRLAELNTQRAVMLDGSEQAIAIEDEQTRLLEEIARAVPITVAADGRGVLTVSIAGHAVVTGADALQLQLRSRTDSTTGEQVIEVWLSDAARRPVAHLPLSEGELASMLWHYNVTVDPQEQSEHFSLAREINRFVEQWVRRINAILATGYGMDDTTAPTLGRRLFEGDDMDTIRLSGDVVGRPRALPLSDTPGEPGNAAVARKLLALAEDSTFIDGMSPQGFYTATVSRIGNFLATAHLHQEWLQASLQQLEAQRQELSGVNLDEEAANLIRYQKAYEASARVATVAATLLDALIRMGV